MSNRKLTIVEELNQRSESLKENFLEDMLDTTTIKTKTLQGNTARAMHYKKCYRKYKPTSIFRHWVHYYFFEKPEVLKMLKYEDDFEVIHKYAVKSLSRFWFKTERKVRDSMPDYFFYKMVDLLFKSICRWTDIKAERREWFFKHVNVPLDKYSLMCLDSYHDDYSIRNPSMNYVESDKHYYKIQGDIKELIHPHPPMLFDLFAWDYLREQEVQKLVSFELIDAGKE